MDMVGRIQALQSQFAPQQPAAVSQANAAAFASKLAAATGTASTAAGGTGGVSGKDVVAGAKKHLGVPYVFGGTNPKTGLDCSGLVQRVFKDLGVKLPRIASDQAKQGEKVPNMAQAKPGDLLTFGDPAWHIGIYVGGNKMLHAPQPGQNVKIEAIWQKPTSIRRIVPAEATAATTATAGVRPASMGANAVTGVPYANLFNAAGAKYGVSPKLLAAIAKVESGYNAKAVSPAGARGLMQIMPATAREMNVNPMDPASAVNGAARIMRGNLKKFGSVDLALAAYNAGGGAVQRYGGIPPFAETQAYVPKVKRALAKLG
ncbi:transglycosylase SLT domain-containing protein [Pilimelia columellifera]